VEPLPPNPEPGLLVIQIDGLSASRLRRNLTRSTMPFLRTQVRRRRLTLRPYLSQVPTSTPAFQAGCFYGTNEGIPGFQFYDKRLGQRFRMGHTPSAQAIERSLPGPGLLRGGSVYSCVYDGGAAGSLFVFSSLLDPTRWRFSLRLWDLLVLSLLHAGLVLRILALALFELLLAIIEFPLLLIQTGRFFGELKLIFIRVGLLILGREMITLNTIVDLQRGVPVIYTNYLGYDECGHYRGPDSASARLQLRAIDRCIRRIHRALRQVDRPYRLIILSDHGQAACVPFEDVEGLTVGGWLQALLDDPNRHPAADPTVSADRVNDREAAMAEDQAAALRRLLPEYPPPLRRPINQVAKVLEQRANAPETPLQRSFRTHAHPPQPAHQPRGTGILPAQVSTPTQIQPTNCPKRPNPDPAHHQPNPTPPAPGTCPPLIVTVSGPTAHAYWTSHPQALCQGEIEALHPGLVARILASKAIGCVSLRGDQSGDVIVLGPQGQATLHANGTRTVTGNLPPDRTADPQHAWDGLRRVTLMERAGDLILWGNHAAAGHVSFLDERGCHAGYSDGETHAFVLASPENQIDFSAFRHHSQFHQALETLRPATGPTPPPGPDTSIHPCFAGQRSASP
jgi:hypothetical protein